MGLFFLKKKAKIVRKPMESTFSYLLQQITSEKKFILSTKSVKLMKISINIGFQNIVKFCPHLVDI